MQRSHGDRLLALFRRTPLIRARDLDRHNLPRYALSQLVRNGDVHRVARGLYVAAATNVTESQSYAEAAKAVPHGVICLLSALRMHGLTTQAPFEVWVAIDVKARKPKTDHPPMRFAHFSGDALTEGVEVRRVGGVDVRVYDPAKTVADCFKFRNKIGLDVALEALRDCLRKRKATRNEIHQMAKVCRVSKVMRPYMEAMAVS